MNENSGCSGTCAYAMSTDTTDLLWWHFVDRSAFRLAKSV